MSLMSALNPVPSTSLFVDEFQPSEATRRLHPGAVFFLTHCHSDHMNGLSRHWRLGELHTSTGSVPYLQRKFGKLPLKTHPVDEPFEVWDPKSLVTLTCTFVDACHCPGAVIIIFEGFANRRGPVIYTGDFRHCDELRQNQTLQRVADLAFVGKLERCQQMFLDTTCQEPSLFKLPEKEHSIRMLLDLLDRFGTDTIFLHSHGLGDEELLAVVGRRSGKLKFACKDRYEEVKIWNSLFCQQYCELLAPARDDPGLQRMVGVYQVIVVPHSRARRDDVRLQHLPGVEISCSTLWYARRARSLRSAPTPDSSLWRPLAHCADGPHSDSSLWQPLRDEYGVWHIIWSMHSSGEELQRFIGWVQPLHVRGICPTLLGESDVRRALPNTTRLTIIDTQPGSAQPEPAGPEPKPAWVTARETREFFSVSANVQSSDDDGLLELLNLPGSIPNPYGLGRDTVQALRPTPTVLKSGNSSTELDDEPVRKRRCGASALHGA